MAKKKISNPADILRGFIDEYHLTAEQVADGIKVSVGTVRMINYGKARISLSNALRLAKFFGTPANYWIDAQLEYDLFELQSDAEFKKELASITKAKKGKPSKPVTTPSQGSSKPAGSVKRSESKNGKGSVKETSPARRGKSKEDAETDAPSSKKNASKSASLSKKPVIKAASGGSSRKKRGNRDDISELQSGEDGEKLKKPHTILIKSDKPFSELSLPDAPDIEAAQTASTDNSFPADSFFEESEN
jgi:addiction module HigA family antidote